MFEERENLLENDFHDSFLKGAEREGRDVRLVIDTDIYLFPGKPFTLLTLKYADNISELQDIPFRGGTVETSINEAKIFREDDGRFNFKLKMEMISGRKLQCKCYNFWTERIEEYKDYRTAWHG